MESQSMESDPVGEREPREEEDPGEMERRTSRRAGHEERW